MTIEKTYSKNSEIFKLNFILQQKIIFSCLPDNLNQLATVLNVLCLPYQFIYHSAKDLAPRFFVWLSWCGADCTKVAFPCRRTLPCTALASGTEDRWFESRQSVRFWAETKRCFCFDCYSCLCRLLTVVLQK
jgi:hypothetical protein